MAAEWEYGSQTTLICVDSYDRQIMKGRLYNPVFRRKEFRSTQEFLAEMDTFLSAMDYLPGAAPFGKEAEFDRVDAEDFHRGSSREGECETFLLRVLFRQNASWQGRITWLEGNEEKNFRSALELLKMMDNALVEKKLH